MRQTKALSLPYRRDTFDFFNQHFESKTFPLLVFQYILQSVGSYFFIRRFLHKRDLHAEIVYTISGTFSNRNALNWMLPLIEQTWTKPKLSKKKQFSH